MAPRFSSLQVPTNGNFQSRFAIALFSPLLSWESPAFPQTSNTIRIRINFLGRNEPNSILIVGLQSRSRILIRTLARTPPRAGKTFEPISNSSWLEFELEPAPSLTFQPSNSNSNSSTLPGVRSVKPSPCS